MIIFHKEGGWYSKIILELMILEKGVKFLNLKYGLNFKVGFAKPLVSPRNPGGARRCPPSSVTCTSHYHDECHGPNAIISWFPLWGQQHRGYFQVKLEQGAVPQKSLSKTSERFPRPPSTQMKFEEVRHSFVTQDPILALSLGTVAPRMPCTTLDVLGLGQLSPGQALLGLETEAE